MSVMFREGDPDRFDKLLADFHASLENYLRRTAKARPKAQETAGGVTPADKQGPRADADPRRRFNDVITKIPRTEREG